MASLRTEREAFPTPSLDLRFHSSSLLIRYILASSTTMVSKYLRPAHEWLIFNRISISAEPDPISQSLIPKYTVTICSFAIVCMTPDFTHCFSSFLHRLLTDKGMGTHDCDFRFATYLLVLSDYLLDPISSHSIPSHLTEPFHSNVSEQRVGGEMHEGDSEGRCRGKTNVG